MATIELTTKTFQETIDRPGIVLVDWWAPWCPPCRMFGPIYEKVSEGNPDATFGKVNTEDQQDLAAAFQISSIPTLMVFRDQVLIFSQAGALPGEALEEILAKVRSLDMEVIRKDIAERERSGSTAADEKEL